MHIDIAALSPEEKQSLYDSLAYDLRGAAQHKPDEKAQTFWNDLNDALDVPKGGRRPLSSFLEVVENKGKVRLAVEILDGLMLQALPPRPSRTLRIQVRDLVLRCLAGYLRARGVPTTPTTLLNNFDKLRSAVDQEYPGYISAQLLHRVVGIMHA